MLKAGLPQLPAPTPNPKREDTLATWLQHGERLIILPIRHPPFFLPLGFIFDLSSGSNRYPQIMTSLEEIKVER